LVIIQVPSQQRPTALSSGTIILSHVGRLDLLQQSIVAPLFLAPREIIWVFWVVKRHQEITILVVKHLQINNMPFPSRIQGIQGKSDLVNEEFDVPLTKLGRKRSRFSSALCVNQRGHKEKNYNECVSSSANPSILWSRLNRLWNKLMQTWIFSSLTSITSVTKIESY
jgi:hypothetical protein